MSNSSLSKSLRLVVHPLTLGALGLLLINDQLLRRFWPSGLTGKLGDVAWLFFAPLAAAAVLALVLPQRLSYRSRLVPLLSFGGVGLIFTAAKVLPEAHHAVVAAAEAVFDFPVGWRRDPTDLFALPGLAASLVLWLRTPESAPSPKLQLAKQRRWSGVALGMAALLTVANSPAPDPGIFCLGQADGKVYAWAAYAGYESGDGAMTWTPSSRPQIDCDSPWNGQGDGLRVLPSTAQGYPSYRYAPGQPIEMSQDGGKTWFVGYTPPQLTEAEKAMAQRRLGTNASMRAVPLDGLIDPEHGNAIFAMGHSGVLVHRQDGQWQPAAVGGYRPPDALSASDFVDLLFGEGLLALATLLLVFVTLVTAADRGRRAWLIFVLAAGWLVWLGIVFLLGPARLYGYGAAVGYIAMLGLGLLILLGLIGVIVRLAGGLKGVAGRAALVALAAALLFLLPYTFWANNTLPSYLLAAGFGAAFTLIVMLAGTRFVGAGARRVAV